MGKCTRKAKTSDEESGVRTRAKTLALKRLHENNNFDFLELRSRRLEKPKLPLKEIKLDTSFGDNHLDAKRRSTRESTPVSLIRTVDSITAPGSSAKPRNPVTPSPNNHIPTPQEIEEFFANVEQSQQQLFIDKYNFDVVNEVPLPGRYEWVKVMP